MNQYNFYFICCQYDLFKSFIVKFHLFSKFKKKLTDTLNDLFGQFKKFFLAQIFEAIFKDVFNMSIFAIGHNPIIRSF